MRPRSTKSKKKFERWINKVIALDPEYAFLQDKKYIDERKDFYEYYLRSMAPAEAIKYEYNEYGDGIPESW